MTALTIYDWITNIDEEVALIWFHPSRRRTAATLVYALTRYTTLLLYILEIGTSEPIKSLVSRSYLL